MTTTENKALMSGVWKFSEAISAEELCRLAEEWKAGPDGEKYLDLHVRKCSKDRWGIGFKFLRTDDSKKTHDAFFYKMTDKLKRCYGNDFVGWDVSSLTYSIS